MPECLICWEEEDLIELPGCEHMFCKSCLRKCIESNTRNEMECPQCEEIIGEDFINDTFDDISVPNNSQEIHCPNCDTVNQPNEFNMIICYHCEYEFCQFCESTECSNYRCDLIQELKDACNEDVIKQCPKCHVLIERISGCNGVICSLCNCHFCWECGKLDKDIDDDYHNCDTYGFD